MTTFAPVSLPQIAPPDPSKHVNYSLGMVLGVDDFVAEFAYSSGRDKRIVRELIGYGVVAGLRVTIETGTNGPRVRVAPGELVTPSGQFVSVAPDQCASLNDWLSAHRAEVTALASPVPSAISLSVVAAYAPCPTDSVPIPGEPCRSDDELQQPSRIQDSFSLELQLSAPAQTEDVGVREFVRWVRRIPVIDAPIGDVDTFIEQLRVAMHVEAASPPSSLSLLSFLLAPPPPSMRIPRGAAAQYLDALFAFWVTELRALVRSAGSAGEGDPAGAPGELDAEADSLRLAELTVPLAFDALSGVLTVADTPPVQVRVDEANRPTLLHLKLIQEWLLAAQEAAEAAPPVFAGSFAADGSVLASRGGLAAHALPLSSPPLHGATVFLLTFPGYTPAANYVVTGQPLAAIADVQASTFEVISSHDPGLGPLLGSPPAAGIVVRARQGAGPVSGGFSVRIEEL